MTLREVSGAVKIEVEPVVQVAVLNENIRDVVTAVVIVEGLLASVPVGAFALLTNGFSPVVRGPEFPNRGTLLSVVLSLAAPKGKLEDD